MYKIVGIVVLIAGVAVGYFLLPESDPLPAIGNSANSPLQTTPVVEPTVQHVPKPVTDAKSTSVADKVVDMISSVDVMDRDSRDLAFDSARAVVESMEADRIVRWAPVSLLPQSIFATEDDTTDTGSDSARQPARLLRLSPFPDQSFIAENTSFRDYGWGAVWVGRLIDTADGQVTVYLAPDDDGALDANIHIASNIGNFNVAATSLSSIHVAAEMNPNLVERID